VCPHPASFRHHERLEALPEVGVGHAQHSGITNVVASYQQVLDLTGEHVLPPLITMSSKRPSMMLRNRAPSWRGSQRCYGRTIGG